MDEDDDRQSDPFGGEEEPEGERPMSYLGAAGFSFATTFLFFFLVSLVIAARPAAQNDLVTKFGCQVVATLLGLFLILRIYAPDPYRPKVRVILAANGEKLTRPRDVNLWETPEDGRDARSVLLPLDPATVGIDPLTYL